MMLNSRKIKLLSTEYQKVQIPQNPTIMDYAIQYVKEKDRNCEILVPINHMRLRKRMYLPYELISKNSESKTKEYREEIEYSYMRWKFKIEEVPNLLAKTKKI